MRVWLVVLAVGCTHPDQVRQVVGSEGGTVESPDGLLEVVIPEGALSEDVEITIELAEEVDDPMGAVLGDVYEIGPSGTRFDQAITLRFAFDPEDYEATLPYGASLGTTDSSGIWRALEEATWDDVDGILAGRTWHLSPYGGITGNCGLVYCPSTSTFVPTAPYTPPASPGGVAFPLRWFSAEEDNGAATFTVAREGGRYGEVTAVIDILPGEGSSLGMDYRDAVHTVTWADGEAGDRSFTLTLHDDATVEGTEKLFARIRSVSGGANLPGIRTAGLRVFDDDMNGFAFRDNVYDFLESDNSVLVTVDRKGTSFPAATVLVDWDDPAGVMGSPPGRIEFQAGEQWKSQSFPTRANAALTGTRQATLSLRGQEGPRTTAIVRARDAEALGGIIEVGAPNYDVFEPRMGEPSYAEVVVRRRFGSYGAPTVDYTITDDGGGTVDTGHVAWADGDVRDKVIQVAKVEVPDRLAESFVVTLSNPSGCALGAARVSEVTVHDDDDMDNVAEFVWPLEMVVSESAGVVEVPIAIHNPKDNGGMYYSYFNLYQSRKVVTDGTFRFFGYDVATPVPDSIRLALVDDDIPHAEPARVDLEMLNGMAFGVRGNPKFTVWVIDDDLPARFDLQAEASGVEGSPLTVPGTITDPIAGVSDYKAAVILERGTASAADHGGLSPSDGVISFDLASLEGSATVPLTQDQEVEADETLFLYLDETSDSNEALGPNWISVLTIDDDDLTVQGGLLSARVVDDADGDGWIGPGETGISGVPMTAWRDTDGDGQVDTQVGGTQTTDALGWVTFLGLSGGLHEVRVDENAPDLDASAIYDTEGTASVYLDPGEHRTVAPFLYGPAWSYVATVTRPTTGGDTPASGISVQLTTATATTSRTTFEDGIARFDHISEAGGVLSLDAGKLADQGLVSIGNEPPQTSGRYTTRAFSVSFPGSVSGLVFRDRFGNGEHDFGEPLFDGVTVTAVGPGGTVTTQTVAGAYAFSDLPSGTWTVSVDTSDDALAGLVTTVPSEATLTLTSDDTAGEALFGFAEAGTLSGRVFVVQDDDLVYDAGVDAAPGDGAVLLYRDADEDNLPDTWFPVQTLSTAADGTFQVTLSPGRWFFLPTDQDDASLQPLQGTYGNLVNVFEGATQNGIGLALGNSGAIDGTVFHDVNGNGIQDGGEAPVAATASLDRNTAPAGPVTSEATQGGFGFAHLLDGTYTARLDFQDPSSYGTVATTGSLENEVTLTGNAVTLDPIGLFGLGSISGNVYDDRDGDGFDDGDGEPGRSGISVQLWKIDGSTAIATGQTDVTDVNGNFTITGVGPGEHALRITAPANQEASSGTYTWTSASKADLMQMSIGIRHTGTLSGVLFADDNGNGVKDGTESGFVKPLEIWWDEDGDGTYTLVRSFVPPIGGAWTAEHLGPGKYKVLVDPSNLVGTVQTAGLMPWEPTLAAGGSEGPYAMGITYPGTITGIVFSDDDGDSVHDSPGEGGVSGAQAVLFRKDAQDDWVATATDDVDAATGEFTFADLRPGAFRIDVQNYDTDLENTTANLPYDGTLLPGSTHDGILIGLGLTATVTGMAFYDDDADGVKDPGEVGIAGVFFDLNGPNWYTGPATVADGTFTATNLPSGAWTVAPAPYNPALAGLVRTTPYPSVSYDVPMGGTFSSLPFGWAEPGTLQGAAFHDANADTVWDPGEKGLKDATVHVFRDVDGDGTYETWAASVVLTDTGTWSVPDLLPGEYRASIDVIALEPDNLGVTTEPTGVNPADATVLSGQTTTLSDVGFTLIEVCDDGEDDDHDTLVDCDDPDCAADPACTASSFTGQYDLVLIPPLVTPSFGGFFTSADDIDEQNRVVGETAVDDLGFDRWAYVLDDGTMTVLDKTEMLSTGANAIDDNVVVGTSVDMSGVRWAVMWDLNGTGALTDLADTGHVGAEAFGIHGTTVAGAVWNGDEVSGQPNRWAMSWRDGLEGPALQTLTGDFNNCEARAVNAAQVLVGYCVTATNNEVAVSWDADGVITEHEMLGASDPFNFDYGIAYGVTDAGDIVGTSHDLNGYDRATLWPAGGGAPVDLGGFGGSYSYAYDINTEGTIVGTALDATQAGLAFVWHDGTLYELSTLLTANPGDFVPANAVGINDNGWIVGNGYDTSFNQVGFIAIPAAP